MTTYAHTQGRIATRTGTATLFQNGSLAVHVDTATAGNVAIGACGQMEWKRDVWQGTETVADLYALRGDVCERCWRSVFPLPKTERPAPEMSTERRSAAFPRPDRIAL